MPGRLARRYSVLLVAMVLCGLLPALGLSQTTVPGGPTPGGGFFDRFREDTTRPMPNAPPRPPTAPRSDMIWVPDRSVPVLGVPGSVFVPGHWEQRLSDHAVYVPPLTGRSDDGRTIELPAGRQRPPDERVSPRMCIGP